MSEQSGPITREQVERLLADTLAGGNAFSSFYRSPQRELAPAYVLGAWEEDGGLRDVMEPALTRWRDELAAAEPVRRVARWDARRGAYVALDGHGTVCMITLDRADCIAWGYEIEGGPEPVRDWKSDRAIAAIWPTPKPAEDSPERLRERREALGWDLDDAADACTAAPASVAFCVPGARWHTGNDIARLESREWPIDDAIKAARVRYAAALSAEEARRAAVGAWAAGGGVLHYSPPTEPERPAPRFKVGDRVTSGLGGPWKIGRVEWGRLVPEADCDEWVYHHASGNVSACESVLALAWTPTPASPPAPEVVDVPQPIVKRCGGVEAQWDLGEDHVTLVEPARGVGLPAPLALLRAMLAAIDAQQGGAS